ncbi:MAG: C40 family peptidase [Methylosarcina sp.]
MMLCNKRNKQDFYLRRILPLLIVLITGCSSAPKIVPIPTFPSSLPPVARYAVSLVGAPYRYGKASRLEGFDCSGFVQHVYGRYGVRLPRTAREMAMALPPAEPYELRSGDLVFFDTEGNRYSHVGLFVKGDEFVHASSSRTGKVMVSSLNNPYWRKHYSGARRVR